MTCHLLSFSHHQLALGEREKLAQASDFLHNVRAHSSIGEFVTINTCNRNELYYSAREDHTAFLINALSARSGLELNRLKQAAKAVSELDVLSHLLELAAGLHSMILGEGQILGQIRKAYFTARDAGHIDTHLTHYFEYTLHVAKAVRHQTGIDRHPISMAHAAVKLARHLFGDLTPLRALILGAGENTHLIAQSLKSGGLTRLAICNRTQKNAEDIARLYDARVLPFDALHERLHEVDILIASTASTDILISKTMLESALDRRKHRPVFIVDLAVPRDIDPAAKALDDIYLYATDDLQHVLDDNLAARQEAASQARVLINEHLKRFTRDRANHTIASIRAYRAHAEALRQRTLDQVRVDMAKGLDPDKALERLSALLTNRLTHAPTQAFKRFSDGESPFMLELLEQSLLKQRDTNSAQDES